MTLVFIGRRYGLYVVCVSSKGVIHPNHQYGTLDMKGYIAVRLDKNVEKRPTYSTGTKKI